MLRIGLLPLLAIGFIAVVVVVVAVAIVVVGVRSSRNRDDARPAGVGTGEAQPSVRPQLPAAAQSIEERLAELDSLRARGVISYDEYVSARQRAIDGSTTT